MLPAIFRLLVVSLFALVGQTAQWWRVWLCVLAAGGLVAATYWISPHVLPLWPAVAALAGAAAAGALWEWRAQAHADGMLE